jgi:hypothetical protein
VIDVANAMWSSRMGIAYTLRPDCTAFGSATDPGSSVKRGGLQGAVAVQKMQRRRPAGVRGAECVLFV